MSHELRYRVTQIRPDYPRYDFPSELCFDLLLIGPKMIVC